MTRAGTVDITRDVPHDLAAEQAVLGALLLIVNPTAFLRIVATGLRAAHFIRPAHRELYDHILGMFARGEATDALTVKAYLDANGWPAGVDASYLHTLMETVPTTAHAEDYARIIVDRAGRRLALEAVARADQRLRSGHVAVGEIEAALAEDLAAARATTTASSADESRPRRLDWADFWKRAEERPEVDYIAYPLIARGETVTAFSGPKQGKSLLALEIAVGAALGGYVLGHPGAEPRRVLYLDQEMTEVDLAERLDDLGHAGKIIENLGYYQLQDWPALDTAEGGAALVAEAREFGADLVVFDTQSKLVEGEENESKTMTAFYRHTLRPLKQLGAAAFNLDHSGHDTSRTRGTSAKAADVDHVWRLEVGEEFTVVLTRTHGRSRANDPYKVMYRREIRPLRHVPMEFDAGLEKRVEDCLMVMRQLRLLPHVTTREAGEAVKVARGGRGFANTVVVSALRRYHQELAE